MHNLRCPTAAFKAKVHNSGHCCKEADGCTAGGEKRMPQQRSKHSKVHSSRRCNKFAMQACSHSGRAACEYTMEIHQLTPAAAHLLKAQRIMALPQALPQHDQATSTSTDNGLPPCMSRCCRTVQRKV
eukprot:scaffold13096_cov22-Tisochrysis_lutea.AAC.2